MAEWITTTLEECTDILGDGLHGTPKYTENGEYAFVNGNNLVDGEILIKKETKRVDYSQYDKYKKPLTNRTILVSINGTLGNVGVYGSEKIILGKSACYFNVKESVDKDFIYYIVSSPTFKQYLESNATGTTIKNISLKQMREYTFELPEIGEQKRISSVLRKIDEKIKNNRAINNNLEQQAQAIFKSWFIDFEPFGGVQPPEMKFVPLQELCKVVTKGTTPTTLGKPFTSSGINFIKAESILDSHSIDSSKFAFIDEETNALLKRSVIKANDIVFTIAGTLGRFAMVDNSVLPANTNQAVAIIRPDEKKVTPAYLYSFFIGNWHNEYYSKRIQQAVQANLNLTTIKSLPIAVLSNTTMNNYDELVSPLFALMKGNEEENRRLSELRDTLLPKLMSSELDVSNIEF